MQSEAKLEIRLVSGAFRPSGNESSVNELRGGPETLLRWLETQLGLPVPAVHIADRIAEYAAVLDTVQDAVFSASMTADRWATASELLSRRDELMLSGWGETDSDLLPTIVRNLVRDAEESDLNFAGEATRLRHVLDALKTGQTLPPHCCVLHDDISAWPTAWQPVLSQLNVSQPTAQMPAAAVGCSLRIAQEIVRGESTSSLIPDSSFRYVHTRSHSASVEFVAATLAASRDKLATTVICCEDDNLAMQLDACLNRIGLPTCGASGRSRAHPALQVLPLSLALCWTPVDPQALLDFLTLPILPLPRKVASRLAQALSKEPGLGSSEWDSAVEELCDPEQDPDGKLREQLATWFGCATARTGSEIPAMVVRERCGIVAKWATGRALLMAKDEDADVEQIAALHAASGQAALLGELALLQGKSLTQPQLVRLLDEAIGSGVETRLCIEADGGPARVRSLGEIDGPCDRLIWLGLGTADTSSCRWSTSQLRQLHAAGIHVDDGSKVLSALRSAEARGLGFVHDALLAVHLPQDALKRLHPLWLAIEGCLSEADQQQPCVLEELITAGQTQALTPFVFDVCDVDVQAQQPLRPLWDISSDLMSDRDTVSATELNDRLACPLKWTLNYQARIRSSQIATLPDDFQLKGTFCHSILERVFGSGGTLPSVDDAVAAVTTAFDERLPLDAAPLAQPGKLLDSQSLRSQMQNATRVLISSLATGGYRITGIETTLSGTAFGKTLNGSIDCVAERDDGEEAVIDFKYGGRSKYHDLIEEGKAVQLATYAYGRHTERGKFPAVAYLVLSDGLMFTPSGSPVQGDGPQSVIDAVAIQDVWQQFETAVVNAEHWLTSSDLVPARPLQESDDWPDGATMVLHAKLPNNSVQKVCQYCDYQTLCGLHELS